MPNWVYFELMLCNLYMLNISALYTCSRARARMFANAQAGLDSRDLQAKRKGN